MLRAWIWIAFSIAGVVACGGSESSGGPGSDASTGTDAGDSATGTGGVTGSDAPPVSGPAFCEKVCNQEASANCSSSQPLETCLYECGADIDAYIDACGPTFQSYAACLETKGTIKCGSSGDAIVGGCSNAVVAFQLCAVCVQAPNDDPCETCNKTACCTEFKELYEDPNLPSYYDCVYACTSDACQMECLETHPLAGGQAFQQCAVANCSVCLG